MDCGFTKRDIDPPGIGGMVHGRAVRGGTRRSGGPGGRGRGLDRSPPAGADQATQCHAQENRAGPKRPASPRQDLVEILVAAPGWLARFT
jgi:hypothetical protein